ncbi:HAD family hydrolase [Terrisporobacter petrolearius]|uniref:HAD family hydrolase n=1 Tax=Terrisporobacter petrolearius TaxID=1460447 RepID=UPI0031CC87FC
MKYTHIVFDVDGTLIDSEKAVLKSLQKTIKEEGVNKSLDDLKFALGIPGKDALSILGIEDLEGVEEKWNENLLKYSDEMILFEGIKQVIQALKCKKLNLGIITSKTRKEYETDFLKFGLNSYFQFVICADDTTKHKPDKEPMEKYIEITKASKEETIYVGDSIYDMQCSKGAGVDFALALWGANETEKIKPTYKLKAPKSILDIIMKSDIKNMK